MERNWKAHLIPNGEEKPLDTLCTDGGMSGIFRTVGCVGDSLSSGEFEATNEAGEKTYHDMFEYSWGQYLARMAGAVFCKAERKPRLQLLTRRHDRKGILREFCGADGVLGLRKEVSGLYFGVGSQRSVQSGA